jgi:Arc/MetJ-type ribon-helix-helix transcriptional regulator
MKTVSLKLPEGLHRDLERTARERGQSKSDVVRAALERFLDGGRAGRGPRSALALAGDLVGCIEGPGDLATNPKYLEGLGT